VLSQCNTGLDAVEEVIKYAISAVAPEAIVRFVLVALVAPVAAVGAVAVALTVTGPPPPPPVTG
jgi:hypothetical protein